MINMNHGSDICLLSDLLIISYINDSCSFAFVFLKFYIAHLFGYTHVQVCGHVCHNLSRDQRTRCRGWFSLVVRLGGSAFTHLSYLLISLYASAGFSVQKYS